MEQPGFQEIKSAFAELAATSDDYHVVDSPERLKEIETMAASFVKLAVEVKSCDVEEMRVAIAHFNLAADRWIRKNES